MKLKRITTNLTVILMLFTGCGNSQEGSTTTEATTQQVTTTEQTTVAETESTEHSKDLEYRANHGDTEAQFNLGFASEITNDYEKAIKWYTKAAEQGNSKAQYALGRIYFNGKGTQQDYTKAFEWLSKTAEQGNIDAQCYIGDMYYNGEGVQQDYQKAFEWYTKAAEQGSDYAQYNLGYMYFVGIGTFSDYQKAFEWYIKAAEQGNTDAQFAAGIMYYYGDVIPQNQQKGLEWLDKAAEQGNTDAINFLTKLGISVNPQSTTITEPTTTAKLKGTEQEVKTTIRNKIPKNYQTDENFLCEAYLVNEEKNMFDIDIQVEIGSPSIDDAKTIFYELLDTVSDTNYNIEMYSFTFLDGGVSTCTIMAETGSDTYTILSDGKVKDFTR